VQGLLTEQLGQEKVETVKCDTVNLVLVELFWKKQAVHLPAVLVIKKKFWFVFKNVIKSLKNLKYGLVGKIDHFSDLPL
jgi:hypothetical protein